MKDLIVRISTLALAFGAASAALAADGLPTRKLGKWEMSTESSMMAGQKMVMQQCIDKDTDANMMAQAEQRGADCSPPKITRSSGQVVFENTCKVEGSTVASRGVFSGDFESAYRGDVVTSFSPPMHGMKESRMHIEARWLGPCAAGEKPGSTRMNIPGLGDVDMQQMMKNLPGMRKQ